MKLKKKKNIIYKSLQGYQIKRSNKYHLEHHRKIRKCQWNILSASKHQSISNLYHRWISVQKHIAEQSFVGDLIYVVIFVSN
jgi:hypothetical protein